MFKLSFFLATFVTIALCFPQRAETLKDKLETDLLDLQNASSNLCLNREEGSYSFDAEICPDYFTYCINGRRSDRLCPFRQYFNSQIRQCVGMEECKSIGNETKPSPKALSINCKISEDGPYAYDEKICDDKYTYCSDGIKSIRHCPTEQFYNSHIRRCVSLEECERANFVPEQDSNSPKPIKPLKSSGCSKNKNIFLPVGICQEFYFSCNKGKSKIHKCDAGLVYNPTINACNLRTLKCPQSKTETSLLDILGVPRDEDTKGWVATEGIPENNSSIEIGTIENDQIDCATFGVTTISKHECVPYFWQCTDRQFFAKKCPMELVYDKVDKSCKKPEEVRGCEEFKGASELPVSAPAQTEEEKKYKCEDKEDRYYNIGFCAKSFVACTNGTSRIINCPDGLVYDERNHRCYYSIFCKKEKKRDAAVDYSYIDYDDEHVVSLEPEQSKESRRTLSDMVQWENLEKIDCVHKENGFYELGHCRSSFVSCANGKLKVNSCDDLVYNPATKKCVKPSDCVPEKKHDPSRDLLSLQEKLNKYLGGTKKPKCQNGIHELGKCQQSFVSCTGGAPKIINCESGKVYDAKTNLCVHLSTCLLNNQTNSQYCSKKSDGFYAPRLCEQQYIQCYDKIAYEMKCPGDLVFSRATNSCVYAAKCNRNYKVIVEKVDLPDILDIGYRH